MAAAPNSPLHKTRTNLQCAKWVTEHTGGKYLIIAPLGVRHAFTKEDGPAMDMQIEYVTSNEEVAAAKSQVLITNYERVRDGNIDVKQFAGVGLDEASVLRSSGSKTFHTFCQVCKPVLYRFVFTATPSPNEYIELINYAEFLGIMTKSESKTRFFQRDSTQADKLTLFPHMEKQFWYWLNSWAVFIQKPSDLGYSDEGYDMPGMKVHWHKVDVDHKKAWSQTDRDGQAQLMRDDAQGLAEGAAIKRESISVRLAAAQAVINADDPSKHWIIWHDLEAERAAIEKAMPDVVTVYGTQDLEEREDAIIAFSRGEISKLGTKPTIAGSGCNFQHFCADAVFLGVGFKFNDFIQAIKRLHRFQQKRVVNIHIFYLESEQGICDELKAKWARHDKLMATMSQLLQQYKLENASTPQLLRSFGCERDEATKRTFKLVNNDCVTELMSMDDNSVDMVCTSIPFGNQYEYSPSFNDFGHNTMPGFFEQMDFLVPELLRVLRPGRIAAIHVKDRILFGNYTGFACPTLYPFSDETRACFQKHGFLFMARITIDTDVVRENNQTYRLGWSENAKDSSKMGAGMPEYVLVFRKLPTDLSDGYADNPVTKSKAAYTRADWQIDAAGFWRSSGNRLPDFETLTSMTHEQLIAIWRHWSMSGGYDHDVHVDLAKRLEAAGKLPSSFMLLPPLSRNADVWSDITRVRTLNTQQSRRNETMHVCPLQLDIIKRLVTRYTNPGETVLDPFAGIGSVPFQAIKMGRKAIGVELCRNYYDTARGYCEMAENELNVPTLFDLMTATENKQAA